MCLAIPAQIVLIEASSAIVNSMGVDSKVNIGLIDNPGIGDYVLLHGGFAIQKIDENYFNYLYEFFNKYIEVENNE